VQILDLDTLLHGVRVITTMSCTFCVDTVLSVSRSFLHQCNAAVAVARLLFMWWLFGIPRLMHKEDCKYVDRYPISVYKSRERKPTCRVCQTYLAKYLNSPHTYLYNYWKLHVLSPLLWATCALTRTLAVREKRCKLQSRILLFKVVVKYKTSQNWPVPLFWP